MTYNPPYTITSKILNLIDKISSEITKLEISNQNIITPKLRKTNQIKTIASSLQIEGNTLDEEKITAILDGKRVMATFKEIAEVNGAIKAYENIDKFDYKSIDDFLLAHKYMMNEVLNNAGNFRNSNVGVITSTGVSHLAPPPIQLPKLINDLFNWLKKTDENKLLISCIVHYEIEFIHPFSDGNGRIGRFWQNLILNSYNDIFRYIPIEELIKKYQKEYYKALEISDTNGSSDYFNEFILEIILESITNFESNQKSSQKSNQKILELIKQNNKITIDELSKITKLSTSGVKKIISKLKQENKLIRIGKKGGYWKIKESNETN